MSRALINDYVAGLHQRRTPAVADEAKAVLGPADLNAATMTAELCDAFADRCEGVARVAEIAQAELAPQRVLFYAGAAGIISGGSVAENAQAVASANWHASAALVARHFPEALFASLEQPCIVSAFSRIASEGSRSWSIGRCLESPLQRSGSTR